MSSFQLRLQLGMYTQPPGIEGGEMSLNACVKTKDHCDTAFSMQSLHINHMQMSIIEVFICRRLHMNTSMILICIWLICRLCTTLHTKCCGAVDIVEYKQHACTCTNISHYGISCLTLHWHCSPQHAHAWSVHNSI